MRVFFIEETDRQRLYLRRYRGSDHKCTATGHYCDAMLFVAEAPVVRDAEGYHESVDHLRPPHDDPRWPTKCEACGTTFASDDPFQLFARSLYRRPDTGEEFELRNAPAGAVWNAWWLAHGRGANDPRKRGSGWMTGPDGRSLVCKLPDGHEWAMDSRCSNCTLPGDNAHFCWVRRGRPEDGTLHVDKNGNTCAAGGGSIDSGKWHGFLHHGELRRC